MKPLPAPVLLTVLLAWGLRRAAGSVVALRELDAPGAVGRVVAVVIAVHAAATALLTLAVTTTGASVGLLRPLVGSAVLALVAGGLGALRVGAAALDAARGVSAVLVHGIARGGCRTALVVEPAG